MCCMRWWIIRRQSWAWGGWGEEFKHGRINPESKNRVCRMYPLVLQRFSAGFNSFVLSWNYIDFDRYYSLQLQIYESQPPQTCQIDIPISRPSIHKRLNIPELIGRKARRDTGTNNEGTHSDLKPIPSGGTRRIYIFWKYRTWGFPPSCLIQPPVLLPFCILREMLGSGLRNGWIFLSSIMWWRKIKNKGSPRECLAFG